MNRHSLAFIVAGLFCATTVHAQLYKSVSADGKISYSDQPPASAVKTERKQLGRSVVESTGLPFELAQVTAASPVTLYTGNNCAPCTDGRALLAARGIPFAEKTVTTNADVILVSGAAASSEIELPQIQIGQNRQRGFNSAAWNASLTAVGYPATNNLPKSYRNPSPQAAAPAVGSETVSARVPADVETSERAKRAASRPGNPAAPASNSATPPGFRF
ncbi:MAG: glutaredoxin family protein [Herminiimonas sp.]|nr:glutaredoxin family protein [Herminiimonas sp.]